MVEHAVSLIPKKTIPKYKQHKLEIKIDFNNKKIYKVISVSFFILVLINIW
jgi:hypothetical protein